MLKQNSILVRICKDFAVYISQGKAGLYSSVTHLFCLGCISEQYSYAGYLMYTPIVQ